jgi:hypothetical protein
VLSLLLDSNFSAGLDGNFSSPGLRDWKELARAYADDVGELLGSAERQSVQGVELIKVAPAAWMAVVHPFWEWNSVLKIQPELIEFQQRRGRIKPATTFDLARRLVSTVEMCRSNV